MVMDTRSRSMVSTSARKVLIVDDEESLRAVLARQIDRLGYRTWQADGGERAVALVAAEVPDAVLVDLRIPAALARALHSAAPVVAVIPPVVQTGAFEALLKDFDADTLMADPSVIIGLWPDLSKAHYYSN